MADENYEHTIEALGKNVWDTIVQHRKEADNSDVDTAENEVQVETIEWDHLTIEEKRIMLQPVQWLISSTGTLMDSIYQSRQRNAFMAQAVGEEAPDAPSEG